MTVASVTIWGSAAAGSGAENFDVPIEQSGCLLNGVDDDTEKFNSFLSELAPGTAVTFTPGKILTIDSGDLIQPPGISFKGNHSFFGWYHGAALNTGSLVYLNPNFSIIPKEGNLISGLKIIRKGLKFNPSLTEMMDGVGTWTSEVICLKTSTTSATGTRTLYFSTTAGLNIGDPVHGAGIAEGSKIVAVTALTIIVDKDFYEGISAYQYIRFGKSAAIRLLSGLGGEGPSGGVALSNNLILGFNTAILAGCGDFYAQYCELDCVNSFMVYTAGNQFDMHAVRTLPIYSMGFDLQYWRRTGVGFYVGKGCTGGNFSDCFSFMSDTGYIVDDAHSISLTNPQAETLTTSGTNVGIEIENEATVQIIGGLTSGYDVALVRARNLRNLVDSQIVISGHQFLPKSTTGSCMLIGPGTQGRIVTPQIINSSVPFLTMEENVIRPWYVLNPSFIAGSPVIEAVVPATSEDALRWSGAGFGDTIKYDPVTNTVTGGNVRGTRAIDFSRKREIADEVASGTEAIILGGNSNKAAGNYSTASGYKAYALGEYSFAIGYKTTADGVGSWAQGLGSSTRSRQGIRVFGSSPAAIDGTQQAIEGVLRATSVNGAAVVATFDGQTATTTNTLHVRDSEGGAYNITVYAVATSGTGGWASYNVPALLVQRGVGAATIQVIGGGTIAATRSTGTITGWSLVIATDTTLGSVKFTFTGAAGQTVDANISIYGVER